MRYEGRAVSGAPLLEARGLGKDFGGLRAVHALDFAVAPGQIKGIIGPNGAGKTTVFNMICGELAPTRGSVLFEGRRLPVRRPHAVAARGIARTFQLVRLFDTMTVREHVLVGCHRRGSAGWAASTFRTRAMRQEERRLRAWTDELLDLLDLAAQADRPAATLPYGAQRLVEVGRALGMAPRLLLLDEPGAGLDADEQGRLARLIRALRDRGTTVLLVDHHVEFVMGLSDEVLALGYGEKLADGPPPLVRSHPAVIDAYLGRDEP
jgi:ABC-type branched-subunit amino acid transport system ATPase component